MKRFCKSALFIIASFIMIGILTITIFASEDIDENTNYNENSPESENELEPIIYDGVYSIYNWNTLQTLTVQDYGISNLTNVRCEYPATGDLFEPMNKNQLWLVTHLGNNRYSFRIVMKPNMALDVTGTNVDIYGIGITEQNVPSYAIWEISVDEDYPYGYVLKKNGSSNEVLCRDYNTSNVGVTSNYDGNPDCRWGFRALTSSEIDEIVGVTVFGPTTVSEGSHIQLIAGVFSLNTLNQSVTFSSSSWDATVLANGQVTGINSGLAKIFVQSDYDSSCSGLSYVAITEYGRHDATLIGIPDQINPSDHDHISYFSNTSAKLRSILGRNIDLETVSSIPTFYGTDTMLNYMISSDVFVFRGHGRKDLIYIDGEGAATLTYSEINRSVSRSLENSDLVLYMCCLAGQGGASDDNMVTATFAQGAKNVIGFKVQIGCIVANQWITDFFNELATQSDISTSSIQYALNHIRSTYSGTSVSFENTVFIHQ